MDPIVISDTDDDHIIVISDTGEECEDDGRIYIGIARMQESIRRRCIPTEGNDTNEIERIMNGSGFDSLTNLNDEFDSACNKMSILLWMNTVTDNYWSYIAQEAIRSNGTPQDVQRLLANKNDVIDGFIGDQCLQLRLLRPPIPDITAFKKEFLCQFRARFPPMWFKYVMTSDSEIIFGHDLPSYWERVLEIPRKFY